MTENTAPPPVAAALDRAEAVVLCPGCLHDGVLELTLERAEAAEAKLLEYENAITWHTSCLSCSAFLDRANAERERAERAEARLAAITDACRSIPSPIANRILAIISEEVHLGG